MDILDSFTRQLGVESGNRQFDSKGHVIVSPKGAVGAAQLMPAAAKEGAAYAGLPYDANRIATDGDYNRAVGKGYKDKLLVRFNGDDRAATAAYNGGPTRIAGLQARYGADWEAHLTGESHDYLTNVLGQLGTPVTSTPATSSTTPQADVNIRAPAVSAAKDRLGQADSQMTDILGAAGAAVMAVQAQRVDDLGKFVKAKDAILSDTEAATHELADRVKPIFAQRAAIAHRQTELATMNPFKKAILGVVNRNYNEKDLSELDKSLAHEAEVAGQEYQTNTAMQDTLARVVQGHYEGQAALSQMHLSNIDTDLSLADKGISQIRQQFSDAVQGVQSDAEIVRAKATMRADALSQMDPGQINSAVAMASRGDGFTNINGVAISRAELLERQQQLEGQRLALEGQKIGVQSGAISLQRNQEERLISHMSSADIQSAIKAGGVFQGVQLDQGQLTSAYANSLQRGDLLAGQTGELAAAHSYAQTVDALSTGMNDTMRRVTGVVGAKLPPDMQRGFSGIIQEVNQYSAAIRSAPTPEAANKLRASFLPKIQSMYDRVGSAVDATVKGMTRNPDAQVVLKGFMTGQQPTGEQATRGMIALVQGGALPPGVKLSGPAASAMTAARKAVQAVYTKYAPGKAPVDAKASFESMMQGDGKGGKPNAAQLNQELATAVNVAVSKTWVNANLNQMVDSIPQMAQQDKHPAGSINPQDYRTARAQGEQQGIAALATRLGWTADQTEAVFGPNGSGADGFAARGTRKDGITFDQATQNLVSIQTQYFLRNLDTSPSSTHDLKPSAAVVDYMQSPAFQQRVGAFNRNIGHVGLGEMLADSTSGGSLGQVVYKYASAMSQAAGANDIEDQNITRSKIAQYKGSPIKRAGIILAAVPGLNPQDQATLMKAITQGVGPDVPGAPTVFGAMTTAGQRSDIHRIDSMVLHGKFQDPHLEKLRQIAAKHWVATSTAGDSFMARLMGTDQ